MKVYAYVKLTGFRSIRPEAEEPSNGSSPSRMSCTRADAPLIRASCLRSSRVGEAEGEATGEATGEAKGLP